MRLSKFMTFALFSTVVSLAAPPDAQASSAHLYKPYQAVYGLSLKDVRDSGDVTAISGRLVFKLDGDSCNGYITESRFVMSMVRENGSEVVTDISSSNWEAGDGKTLRFFTSTRLNGQLINSIQGTAEKQGDKLLVSHTEPEKKTFTFSGEALFPMAFHKSLMKAVKDDDRFFSATLFDGGEEDGSPVDVTAVLGAQKSKTDDGKIAGDPVAPVDAFWPINMAYFNGDAKSDSGPDYMVNFQLAADGIERAMLLDYGDFTINAELENLDIGPLSDCKK